MALRVFIVGLFLLALPRWSSGQLVEELVLPMTPLRIDEKPASFVKIGDRKESRESSLAHRRAMNESWEILVQRNSDAELDRMLTDRPAIGDQEIQSWYLYMAKRFGPQVATVMAATKSGRPAKIEPEWDRQGHPMLEIYAANGAIFLAPALFDWTLDQLDEKGSESVLENLPWIMLVLEDWSQQTDCFMRFSGAIENGLMAIAIEKDVPNLGPALLNLPSPYRSAGNLFSEYRDAFLYFGRSNADELAVIQDLRVTDEDVIDDCKRLVGFVYENYGIYQNHPAETLEAFFTLLEKQVESNRETLRKEDVPVDDYPDVSPLRLAVMASIVRTNDCVLRAANCIACQFIDRSNNGKKCVRELHRLGHRFRRRCVIFLGGLRDAATLHRGVLADSSGHPQCFPDLLCSKLPCRARRASRIAGCSECG